MRDLTQMTLVQSIKELKLIKRKIRGNAELIEKYSSQSENEKPLIDTTAAQVAEINSLIQSSESLVKEYSSISSALAYTNLITRININSKDYSIHELICLKRELHDLMILNYRSMNDNNFNKNTRMNMNTSPGVKNNVERYYDEKYKQMKIREAEDLFHEIDCRLENVNATTYLSYLPV